MASDPRIAALPAVRKLAEKQAKARHAVSSSGVMRLAAWEDQPDDIRAMDREVEIRLLSNLELVASRDAVARLVAEAVGLPKDWDGVSLGRYRCGEHCDDGDTGRMERCDRPIWSLMVSGYDPVTFADCTDEDGEDRRHVPGISTVTDSAEALTLIALSVLS